MKQPYNKTIYNTALYLRLSRDDELQGESELALFLNILNEMHTRQTSKMVKVAMHTRFATGAHYRAYAPIGYIKDPDKIGHLSLRSVYRLRMVACLWRKQTEQNTFIVWQCL